MIREAPDSEAEEAGRPWSGPAGTYGFENGEPVPFVDADLFGSEPDVSGATDTELTEARLDGARRVIAMILTYGDGGRESITRRALLYAHALRVPNCPQSQRELAAKMGLSPARVNALLRNFANELARSDLFD